MVQRSHVLNPEALQGRYRLSVTGEQSAFSHDFKVKKYGKFVTAAAAAVASLLKGGVFFPPNFWCWPFVPSKTKAPKQGFVSLALCHLHHGYSIYMWSQLVSLSRVLSSLCMSLICYVCYSYGIHCSSLNLLLQLSTELIYSFSKDLFLLECLRGMGIALRVRDGVSSKGWGKP